jgi:hypothetical protein
MKVMGADDAPAPGLIQSKNDLRNLLQLPSPHLHVLDCDIACRRFNGKALYFYQVVFPCGPQVGLHVRAPFSLTEMVPSPNWVLPVTGVALSTKVWAGAVMSSDKA